VFSVWYNDDKSFLEQALDFYPHRQVTSILDCTVNRGRFWKDSKYKTLVTGMDINPIYGPALVDDNRVMSTVADGSFDVVVYDPPHLPNQGGDKAKDFRDRFGLGEKSSTYSLSHDFPAVLSQVKRVLKDDGLCLAKVTDYVHNHRYRWVLLDLVQAVRSAGMTPCDLLVKVRKGPIMDPKWKTRHHARKCHSYWVAIRNSHSCE
jgi:SAM-dependent methyltransferase